jgi:transcriptional regulator with PAS, ATPase and Fis domain
MRELVNPVWMKTSVALLAIEQRKPATIHHSTRHGKNIMATGTPIFDKNGKISKVVINSRDISEIYHLREELSKFRELEKQYFRQAMNSIDGGESETIVSAPRMVEIYSLAKKIADFNTSVLITGESGCGKDVLAGYIHEHGKRKEKRMVAVNCGAIPESLLESELFGYDEGAFTGAVKGGKSGLIEAADGGTLFLDEIGEMSLSLQVKLLRVLESPTITPIGSQRKIHVDFRLITATNKDLSIQVEEGTFREDLFYRLNVITISIPPLRERKEEIGLFSLLFLHMFNRQYGLNKKLTIEVLKELENQPWKGNVRQLKNVIEYMSVVSPNEYLQLDDLPWMKRGDELPVCVGGVADVAAAGGSAAELSYKEHVERFERELLLDAKRKYGSSRKIAAALKLDQSTVIRKLRKLNISES